MEEKRETKPEETSDSAARRPASAATPKPTDELKGAPLYLRWLAILCAIMAAFCLGVFIIGYKDPSIGRVATFVALAIACPALLYLSKKPPRH